MFNKKIHKIVAGGMAALALVTVVAPMCAPGYVMAETVDTKLQLKKIAIDLASPQNQGTEITITPECFGGTGELSYTYKVKLPGEKSEYETIADESSNESVTYTLQEAGVYNFYVEVKDSAGTVQSDEVEFVAKSTKVMLNNVSFNKAKYAKKDNVQIAIKATAASGTVKSKVVVTTPNGKKVTVKKLSTKMKASYKVTKKGTYKFTITVKDSKTSASTTKSIKVK